MKMSPKEFRKLFDHTILRADATSADVERICDEAIKNDFCTVCVHGMHLPLVVKKLEKTSVLPICVVGFPFGAQSLSTKIYETRECVDAGAQEIDMVIPIGWMRQESTEKGVITDIEQVVQAARKIPVKVIIETALLTPEQIRKASIWSCKAGAAFVKTSTGYSTRGASVEDIQIIKESIRDAGCDGKVAIKASGGIKTLEQVEQLVAAGASRIGSSQSFAILESFIQRRDTK